MPPGTGGGWCLRGAWDLRVVVGWSVGFAYGNLWSEVGSGMVGQRLRDWRGSVGVGMALESTQMVLQYDLECRAARAACLVGYHDGVAIGRVSIGFKKCALRKGRCIKLMPSTQEGLLM